MHTHNKFDMGGILVYSLEKSEIRHSDIWDTHSYLGLATRDYLSYMCMNLIRF